MRGGFGRMGNMRGFGNGAPQAAGTQGGTAAPANYIPPAQGGNATQGDGLDFIYQTPNVATLTAGSSSGAQTIQFDNNSTFLWLRTTFTVDLAEAAFTSGAFPIPLVTIQIQDTGNGMSFMNAAIPVYAIAGYAAGLPYILPKPQFVQPNASYNFTWVSYEATQELYNLRLQLHGVRIFNS